MSSFASALWVEFLKARRSRMPLFTALGFSLAPLAGGFFMVVIRDPELARRLGVISTKAQIIAGPADWQTYLGMLAQAVAVGGILLFGLVVSWVFGREFADCTVKDWLALPVARSAVVLSKFIVVAAWSAGLTAMIFLIALVVGNTIALPASAPSMWQGIMMLAVTALLTISLVTPIAFVASAGRGYLPPMGLAILALILAQIIAAAGWGEFFPWSVPALRSGMSGAQSANPGWVSYLIVLGTSFIGFVATFAWWELADQTQ